MKFSFFATAIFALSMAGTAAAATSAEAAPSNAALATTDIQECVPNAVTVCEELVIDGVAHSTEEARKQAQNAKVDAAALPVPEPQTFVMLMLGLVVLGFASRRNVSERFDQ